MTSNTCKFARKKIRIAIIFERPMYLQICSKRDLDCLRRESHVIAFGESEPLPIGSVLNTRYWASCLAQTLRIWVTICGVHRLYCENGWFWYWYCELANCAPARVHNRQAMVNQNWSSAKNISNLFKSFEIIHFFLFQKPFAESIKITA